MPYIPEHQSRTMLGLAADKWHVNIAVNFTGKLRTKVGRGAFDPKTM